MKEKLMVKEIDGKRIGKWMVMEGNGRLLKSEGRTKKGEDKGRLKMKKVVMVEGCGCR